MKLKSEKFQLLNKNNANFLITQAQLHSFYQTNYLICMVLGLLFKIQHEFIRLKLQFLSTNQIIFTN
jgi:hypothetical protein